MRRPGTPPWLSDGFSLIELLIVVGLVATLAAIGIPGYVNTLERARITRAIGDIRGIETDLRVYQAPEWHASGAVV